jgi:hypothetical protein
MSVSSLNKSSSFVLALFVFFFTVLDGNISSSCKANIVYFQREKFENIKVVIRNHISKDWHYNGQKTQDKQDMIII